MGRTMEEWIEFYERKTGEKLERQDGWETFYHPDKGFCQYRATEDMIIINQLCGDIHFWKDKAEAMARDMGISHLGTWYIRENVRPYARLLGFEVYKEEELPGGLKRYYGRNKVTGKEGLASPAFKYKESGRQAYFITWEI
jgi:hypothetical protein